MLFVIWIVVSNARAGALQENLSLIEMVRLPGSNLMDTFAKIYFGWVGVLT